jgi:hypothetical protein
MTVKRQVVAVWTVVSTVTALALIQTLLPGPGVAKSPTVEDLLVRVAALEAKLACVTTTPTTIASTDGWDVVFERCNVYIQNGADTTGGFGNINGFGNLIIGYNRDRFPPDPPAPRGGSHNLVVGDQHSYSAWGGIVGGFNNTISGPEASVTGGHQNTASGQGASVSGGLSNRAEIDGSSIGGGTGCVLSAGTDEWGAVFSGGAIGDCP